MHEGTELDRKILLQAIKLAEKCPPGPTFAVGAIITDAAGNIIATGYSRENDPHDHAEEAALAKVDLDDTRLPSATIYSSLEPCSKRASRPTTCTQHIIDARIPRIVFAWREPDIFVDCEGAELLRAADRQVFEVDEFAHLVRATNASLIRDHDTSG